MSKKKLKIEMYSYGLYESWRDKKSGLPKIIKHTKNIPAEIDIEFGYVLKIIGGKGKKIYFTMEHPPFKDSKGNVAAPFKGFEYIKTNEFLFFLGDCIWAPVEDKKGIWQLSCEIDGEKVSDMSFTIS
jgi:hypothetical protein